MKRTSLYHVAIGLLFSCTQQNKNTETTDTLNRTAEPTAGGDTTVRPTTDTDEEDCVFNNDYKGLTTDWLKELKMEAFIWRDDGNKRLFPKEKTQFFSNRVVVPTQHLWLS